MSLTVGVDVGGTKVAAGVVDEDGTLLVKRRRSSAAQETGATEQVIAELVSELAQAYPVEAVGVGAPGLVDETRSVVRFAPNLAWHDLPLAAQLSELTGLPVVVENDANAAAWAEYRFGAARDLEEVVVVTVGTGIGGGLVLGGRCTVAGSAWRERSATWSWRAGAGRARAAGAAAGSSTRAATRCCARPAPGQLRTGTVRG